MYPFSFLGSGVDAQAQVHYNRVIADGGVVPSGLSGVNAFFSAVKAIYGTSDINTAISAAYDAHYLGYKLGAGSGTTLGQAAQKLYSVKSTENLLLQSGTLSSASWVKEGSTTVTSGQADPNGGTSAWLVSLSGAAGLYQAVTVATNQITFRKLKIRGTAGQTINLSDGASAGSIITITFTGDWQTITSPAFTSVGTSSGFYLVRGGGNQASTCTIFEPQLMTIVSSSYIETTTTASTLADVTQTTAASQPLLLAHEGANYFYSPQVSNNFCSTPSVSINTASGMSVEAQVSFTTNDDSTNAGSGWICSNDDGGVNRNMFLGFSSSRTLIIYWSNLTRSATATAQIPAAYSGWIKASLETSGADMLAKFWTSSDGTTWTQLGATITNSGGANTYQTNNASFFVTGNGGANVIAGKIYRLIYRNASGTTRADFNPASYNAATSQTQWSSATGEVWSINTGTAATGYKSALVTKTIIQGDGVDDRMITSSNIITDDGFTMYTAFRGLKDDLGTGANTFGMNNDDGSISRTNATSIRFWFGASGARNLVISGIDATKLGLAITRRKSGDFAVSFNNGTNNTSTEAVVYTPNLLTIFNYNTTVFTNSIFNTGIITKITDNSTQRTAMYDYIKSINNNAF